ncbi:uncharacterized protein LOC120506860 [Passer montanus]|uniref:uncharacterized protein LOC120506860 n=1 Tax=Passer montanus TaxID=9160 RepID=UPI001961939B|nr:uncharacterized protein LOC120506860 [Passer montanus]
MGDVTGAAVSGSQNQNYRAPSAVAAEAKKAARRGCLPVWTRMHFCSPLLPALSCEKCFHLNNRIKKISSSYMGNLQIYFGHHSGKELTPKETVCMSVCGPQAGREISPAS